MKTALRLVLIVVLLSVVLWAISGYFSLHTTASDDRYGNPGFLVTSYPMSFQSPEGRLAIRLHRRFDWNVGYQFYNYNESVLVGPRPQNYHAHLPYTSLRFYFGRQE